MSSNPSIIRNILPFSRHLTRLCEAHPSLLAELEANLHRPVTRDALNGWLSESALLVEDNLKPCLRRMKRHASARIAARDLAGLASLSEVTEGMTLIAETALTTALPVLTQTLTARYGLPRNETGEIQQLVVIGMGKLGGRELNVSSDIDLIFVYPEDGETDGARRISNSEFFTRLGRALINAIADITEDGYVFRVDMRLRPDGDSGPLVASLDMLENYFVTQGREWERYAWIKARSLITECDYLETLRRPFVFRKYLDFGAIDAMRGLSAQIRKEVTRRDNLDNIKLGPGGIREIEFIAQVFQLIRGGREAVLRTRPTLEVLRILGEQGQLPSEAVKALTEAYVFLRRFEHRLQYQDDAQTHSLPTNQEDRDNMARAMGFDDFEAMQPTLEAHRQVVSQNFDAIFAKQPPATQTRLESLILRLHSLIQDEATVARCVDLLESIAKRPTYLSLLQEYPLALEKLAHMVASSSWTADYLKRHPVLLDELLDPRLLEEDGLETFKEQLHHALDDVEPDTERQMDLMREAHHAQVFRLLARDIAGQLTVERLSDHLSDLADLMVGTALTYAWRKIATRHRETPQFAVIAYGKLGGKELGYASDLDLVFLFDDEESDAAKTYSRLATRLNTWLSAQTSAGRLFETDLRLRPNGESGLIVASLASFRKYQFESAWVWEHQALTRARHCAGDARLGAAFEQIRREVLALRRDPEKLRAEVLSMRQKMQHSHATPLDERAMRFDLKHDPGGLVDVEFIVQTLVLTHAWQHPALLENKGNIALLKIASDCELIPSDLSDAVRDAYREYRHLQHALRLQERPGQVDTGQVIPQITAVRALWNIVMVKNHPHEHS